MCKNMTMESDTINKTVETEEMIDFEKYKEVFNPDVSIEVKKNLIKEILTYYKESKLKDELDSRSNSKVKNDKKVFEIFTKFIDVLPIRICTKKVLQAIINILEEYHEKPEVYCKFIIDMISSSLKYHRNPELCGKFIRAPCGKSVYDDAEIIKFAENFLSIVKSTFELKHNLRNLVLNVFFKAIKNTIAAKDLFLLLPMYLKSDNLSGISNSSTTDLTNMTNFVLNLMNCNLSNLIEILSSQRFQQHQEILKQFKQIRELLINYLVQKISNPAIQIEHQIEACKSLRNILSSMEKSHVSKNYYYLQDILNVLMTRFEIFVKHELVLIFRTETSIKFPIKSSVGDICGYNQKLPKNVWNEGPFNGSPNIYFFLIYEITVTVKMITNKINKGILKSSTIDKVFEYSKFLQNAVVGFSAYPSALIPIDSERIVTFNILAGVFSSFTSELKEILYSSLNVIVPKTFTYNFEIVMFLHSLHKSLSEMSTDVVDTLILYFIHNLPKFENIALGHTLVLDIFSIIYKPYLKSSEKFPGKQEIMMPHMTLVAKEILKMIFKAESTVNYLYLLREILFNNENHPFVFICPQHIIQYLFSRIQKNLKLFNLKTRIELLDLCLDIASVRKNDTDLVPLYVMVIAVSLKESHELVPKSLSLLSFLLSSFLSIMKKLETYIDQIIKILFKILSKLSEDVQLLCVKILGKLEDVTRNVFLNIQKLHCKPSTNFEIKFEFQSKNSTPFTFGIKMDKVVKFAYKTLCKRSSNSRDYKFCWILIRTFLTAIMNEDMAKIWSIESERCDSFQKTVIGCQKQNIFKTALIGMFACLCWDENKDMLFFFEICISYYMMMTTEFKETKCNLKVLLEAFSDFLKLDFKGKPETKIDLGIKLFTIILDTIETYPGYKEEQQFHPFIKFMFNKTISLCYREFMYERLFGCYAIALILDRSCDNWVKQCLDDIIKALFYIIEVSVENSLDLMLAMKLLDGIVVKYLVSPQDDYFTYKSCCHSLFKELRSLKESVRVKAFDYLNMINKNYIEPFIENYIEPFVPQYFTQYTSKHLIGIINGFLLLSKFDKAKAALFSLGCRIQGFSITIVDQCLKNLENLELSEYLCNSKKEKEEIYKISLKVFKLIFHTQDRDYKFKIAYLATLSLMSSIGELNKVGIDCLKEINMNSDLASICFKVFAQNIETVSNPKHQARIICNYIMAFSAFITEDERKVFSNKLQNLCCIKIDNKLASDVQEEILLSMGILMVVIEDNYSNYWHEIICDFLDLNPHKIIYLIKLYVYEDKIHPILEYIFENRKDILKTFSENSETILIQMLNYLPKTRNKMLLSKSQNCAIRIIFLFNKFDKMWIKTKKTLINKIMSIYENMVTNIICAQNNSTHCQAIQKMILCIFSFLHLNTNDIGLLFNLFRGAAVELFLPFLALETLNFLNKICLVEWINLTFSSFLLIFPKFREKLKHNILKYIIIPSFSQLLENFKKYFVEESDFLLMLKMINQFSIKLITFHTISVDIKFLFLKLSCIFLKISTFLLKNKSQSEEVKIFKERSLSKYFNFSNYCRRDKVMIIKSYGCLLFSLLCNHFYSLNFATINEVCLELFTMYDSDLKEITRDALNNIIKYIANIEQKSFLNFQREKEQNSKDFLEILKKFKIEKEKTPIFKFFILKQITSNAIKASEGLFEINALIIRTILTNYKIYYNLRSDFIQLILSYIKSVVKETKMDFIKCILVVDAIEIIITWEKKTLERNKQKNSAVEDFLTQEDRLTIINSLFKMLSFDRYNYKSGMMPISGEKLISKIFSLLREGFTSNVWQINVFKIYNLYLRFYKVI